MFGTNANGFPNSYTFPGTTTTITPSVELYGALPNLKYPSSDLYSLEIQRTLGASTTVTIGYAGSSGRHFARLVDQNFLYNQTNAPAFAAYFAQTDSVQNYNSLNLQLRRSLRHNIGYSVVYTYAKSLDQVFQKIDALERSPVQSTIRTLYHERFAPWVAAALAFLALDRLLSGSRLRRLP